MNARPQVSSRRGRQQLAESRRESLRTNLWLIPSALVLVAVALFAVTYAVDRAADGGSITLPAWVNSGSADAARTILTTIAASVLTVVGVVFSITILALTLASTQFGPRMLRNFISDRGTQFTLGTFVGTFVFTVLALGSVAHESGGPFVPHLSVTVALLLLLVDLGVLIYFIHHIATAIQLTEVVHRIAGDLDRAIDDLYLDHGRVDAEAAPLRDALHALETDAGEIPAVRSGYLQAFGYDELVRIATANAAIVRLEHRPGHFVVRGRPLAIVSPRAAASAIGGTLERGHVVGPHRTLQQDIHFAIDQLVEIAIRALSPAVNDTFTALTCVDWLGDALCKITSVGIPDGVHRDAQGDVRVIEAALTYERVVNRAFDKIRQAGRGMPAVNIRQLDALAKVAEYATSAPPRAVLEHQAAMVMRSAEEAVPESSDRDDVRRAYEGVERALSPQANAAYASHQGRPGARQETV